MTGEELACWVFQNSFSIVRGCNRAVDKNKPGLMIDVVCYHSFFVMGLTEKESDVS